MLMNDLSTIVRQMRVFAERNQTERNIGFPEQVILMYLAGRECRTQEEIARYFHIDKGAIAKSMGKLDEKELVVREVDPENKRNKIVTLTPKAEQVMQEMHATYREWEQRIYAGIDPDDIERLERCVAIMAKNSDEMIKGGA